MQFVSNLMGTGLEDKQYSFANTPLIAAQPPLAMASMSHAGLVLRRDMMSYCCNSVNTRCCGVV
jgi:hypothetical protein